MKALICSCLLFLCLPAFSQNTISKIDSEIDNLSIPEEPDLLYEEEINNFDPELSLELNEKVDPAWDNETPSVELNNSQAPTAVSEEEFERIQETKPASLTGSSDNKPQYPIVEETKTEYKVRHPLAAQGLKRITAEGVYIYETPKTESSQYLGFSLGLRSMNNLRNNTIDKSYQDIYGQSTAIYVDVESPFSKRYGNINWLYGISLSLGSGQGYLSDGRNAVETYNLFLIPAYLGLSYHFQYSDKQWFVPYIAAGVDLVGIHESRDDGESLSSYTYGGHANGGIKLKLDYFLAEDNGLQNDYGIEHVWLNLEFRVIVGAQSNIDISSKSATLGLGLEL